jgi:thymidylate synthase (FAD)
VNSQKEIKMRIVEQSFKVIAYSESIESVIELAGRTCYKSEDKITHDSAVEFIQRMKNFKHESVLEHGAISVHFVIDRGVSHELVRHRLASFSQESTRYCNYSKNRFNNEITVIEPIFQTNDTDTQSELYTIWEASCIEAEYQYFSLLKAGATAQEARSVLPTSLKTEIIVTANPREWRHILKLRTTREAHPQMREIMYRCLRLFAVKWPALFSDIADANGVETH